MYSRFSERRGGCSLVTPIPLEQCVARPGESGNYLLVDHLIAVAFACGDPAKSQKERLAFLAGLFHDVGKVRTSWQRKITSNQHNLPLHSWVGAYLLAVSADYLGFSGPDIVCRVLDISDHHSVLSDIEELSPPWQIYWDPAVWEEIDLEGLWRLAGRFFPELSAFSQLNIINTKDFEQGMAKKWFRWVKQIRRNYREFNNQTIKSVLRIETANLISADRFDAAGLEEDVLSPNKSSKALAKLDEWVKQKQAKTGASQGMSRLRQRIQEQIMVQYQSHSDARLYSLELPTGTGKTLLGMRIALHMAQSQQVQRIVYVAPYLSILSQAAQQIKEVTGLRVLEHHHLAALNLVGDSGYRHDDLVLESWQAPVVVTTFNQFVRALTPRRAQNTLRLKALNKAVIILDEPQIMEPEVWNLVLTLLGVLVEEFNSRVVLMSATMPPTKAFGNPICRLVTTERPPERYKIHTLDEIWDEEALAQAAVDSLQSGNSTAVIVNTIRDAVYVFNLCCRLLGDNADQLINLHGAMTPLHKQHQIKQVYSFLEQEVPVLVVSTQVIEAGVDLSFQQIFRCRPIYPSVIQAAGRANRHNEGDLAKVQVVDFRRSGTLDTRLTVYRNSVSREITDTLLPPGIELTESEIYQGINEYFHLFFSRCPAEGGRDLITRAAAGEWSALAGVEVFKEYAGRVQVFVPQCEWSVTPEIEEAMAIFGFHSFGEMYQKYSELGWLSQLSFAERKLFMALLMQFIVPAQFKVARRVAVEDEDRSIWLLVDTEAYSSETGLGGIFGHESDGIFW